MPMIVKKEKFFKKVLTFGKVCCIIIFVAERAIRNADVAHLVERNLAKVEVAGSSPVIRSRAPDFCRALFLCTSGDDALLLIWNVELLFTVAKPQRNITLRLRLSFKAIPVRCCPELLRMTYNSYTLA